VNLKNAHINVLWQGCQPDLVVLNLVIEGKLIYQNTPLQPQLASELEELLSKLFPEARTLLVEPMGRGRSGSGVLKVRPFYSDRGGGCKVVVKFGDISLIEQEYVNFMKYVQGFLEEGNNTSFLAYQRTQHLGGIICSLLGTTVDQVQDFGNFYQTHDVSDVKAVLDQLFRSTCGFWYASHQSLWPLDLTEDYQHILRQTPEQLEQLVSERLKTVEGKEQLFFRSLKGENRPFTNPLQALARIQPFVRPTYVCTTHGDFNQHNILIDSNQHAWLIDFQKTGPSHILRDVAMLDATVRLQLLPASQATLDDRLALEEALCRVKRFGQVEQLRECFSTPNPELAKAYEIIMHLRTLARWMVEKNAYNDMSEYSIALLYHALNALRFSALEMVQREHALLSASLLIESLAEGA
jgi:hypothetical protein